MSDWEERAEDGRREKAEDRARRLGILEDDDDEQECEKCVTLAAALREAREELSKCGKKNCMGQAVEGVRSWVSKEAWLASESRAESLSKELKAANTKIWNLTQGYESLTQSIIHHVKGRESSEKRVAELEAERERLFGLIRNSIGGNCCDTRKQYSIGHAMSCPLFDILPAAKDRPCQEDK